jgi:hypothetical protein
MLLQDHVAAQSDKIGVEVNVFHVMEEDNGMLFQDNVFAHQETGTDFHVFNVLQAKHGILQVFHVPAQPQLSGMVLTVELAQVQADIGIIN